VPRETRVLRDRRGDVTKVDVGETAAPTGQYL
jgi:hypothetical protein